MNSDAIYVQRQSDGSYIDWGRHGPARHGPARWFTGEAAKVIALVLAHAPKQGGRP